MLFNIITRCMLARGQLTAAVLGNWGAGNWTQKSVANVMDKTCGDKGCSVVISPGSNFVGGLRDLQDPLWTDAFTNVYTGKNLNMPFYAAVGSEDWRFNVTSEAYYSQLTYGLITDDDPRVQGELDKETGKEGISQKAIAASNAKFTLPNWYYYTNLHFTEESNNPFFKTADKNAIFVFVDTHMLSDNFPDQSLTAEHWNWLRDALSASASAGNWVIVVGDASIYSSGKIGGSKEMQRTLLPLLKEYGVDMYISGDDYDMELMQDGQLMLLNCGNGAYSAGKGLKSAPNSIAFEGSPGFCVIRLHEDTMTAEFIDAKTGAATFTGDLKKASKSINMFSKSKGLGSIPANVFKALPWGLGGSIGPNGEGGAMTPAIMLFIKVVGTIGLVIYSAVLGIAAITVAARLQRCQKA